MKNINKQFYMLHLFLDQLRYDKNMIKKKLSGNKCLIYIDGLSWGIPDRLTFADTPSSSSFYNQRWDFKCKENYHYEKDCVDFDDDNDDNNDPDDKMTPIRGFVGG